MQHIDHDSAESRVPDENTHKRLKVNLPTREEMILAELRIINELHGMLQDQKVSLRERLHAADVIAHHMSNLNRMLPQTGDTHEFEEQNLGDYVSGVEPRISRRLIRESNTWKRAFLYRKR